MTDFAPSVEQAVAEKDKAETFAESDVTVSHAGTTVTSESVELNKATSIDPWGGAADSTPSKTAKTGIKVEPDRELAGITFDVFDDVGSVDVYLTDSGLTVLDEENGLTGGSTGTLSATMSSESLYYVLADNDGSSYTSANKGVGFPFDEGPYRITAGYDGSADDANNWWVFQTITGIVGSGSMTVSWGIPPDVYAWDTATYQATADNETVDVFVEEDDGGWTEVAGPIARGDAIPADPANDVRFRVEFSRSDTANAPSLDAIYRRWKL